MDMFSDFLLGRKEEGHPSINQKLEGLIFTVFSMD
jgi:hypothetical protein